MTGLALPHLHDTGWIPPSLFVVGAAGAIVTVYFSTMSRKLLVGVNEPGQIRRWLSAPPPNTSPPRATTDRMPSLTNRRQHAENTRATPPPIIIHGSETATPSLYAALVLSLPAMMLQISLSCILLALGIYLLQDKHHILIHSRKIFASYSVSVFAFIGFYYMSKTLKDIEIEQMNHHRPQSASDIESAVVSDEEPRTPRSKASRRARTPQASSSTPRRECASGSGSGSGSWTRRRPSSVTHDGEPRRT